MYKIFNLNNLNLKIKRKLYDMSSYGTNIEKLFSIEIIP